MKLIKSSGHFRGPCFSTEVISSWRTLVSTGIPVAKNSPMSIYQARYSRLASECVVISSLILAVRIIETACRKKFLYLSWNIMQLCIILIIQFSHIMGSTVFFFNSLRTRETESHLVYLEIHYYY